jgi:NitT/TauT family transport system ATP-binding protein
LKQALKRQPDRAGLEARTDVLMEFSDVSLDLGGKTIVEKLDVKIQRGEFVCVIGASGCGKTTALRLAAGLYQPSAGTVTFAGQPMNQPRRDIAIVFQDYGKALLPWRTAAGNVSLALEATGVKPAARDAKIKMLLEKVGLPNHAEKYPAEMSGGMQQRLQIARCLAQEPAALLMDEPFGALDEQTRMILGEDLSVLLSRTEKTIVFVTHSLGEAVFLADRVAVFSARPGRIKEIIAVDEPHPRKPAFVTTEKFSRLRNTLYELLHEEIRKAVEQSATVSLQS